MEGRKKFQSGAPWESVAGYSRAVRVNSLVVVSGTAAVDDKGDVVGIDDPYRQTQRCLEIIEAALQQAGARLEHVVRTRMFVTDISLWQDFARAHRETFKGIEPATSLVQVAKLIDPRMLIEIEADAVIDDD
jgi:enamine deaminase RidA (YjgF/YER057c/UK114 family)